MNWKKELEALVQQSAALVERARSVAPIPKLIAPIAPIAKASPPDSPRRLSWDTSEREHISKRVANFRAHQERVRRERDEYFSRTMQRTRDLARGHGSDEQM
ncbi:hypothetical protein BjapCC829_06120 [Bradyrhizobium barranii]|uniref:Uncharacterized protein n=3 Tax=Bradyrhizobium TaxID=374 RepID=A0A1X3GF08_9BRAD|nr:MULTISPECIES: hypothetical protein [Bradyrhizobium]OSI65774.1 hypothetical protein BSZ22_28950 [Bradyrhizobium canariense]OSI76224.1 hypothetical protein BSZ23_25490 [Bradyrhizobium canariense]OSI87689.1 hypothetical protein BSZ25_26795 [Bradyrhizobium canariense]OSI87741.1 hypothetical protein BSZ24_26080 [Bradyrhizobium canariense]OSI99727.1 hypothetical protein BSZ16_26935 [Bradyrhizobium canariense]